MTRSMIAKQQHDSQHWQQSHHAAVGLEATQNANQRHNHNCIQSIHLLKEENEMLKKQGYFTQKQTGKALTGACNDEE